MLSSMTGYGKGIIQKDDFTIEAEIKSLNSRYLDLSLRVPKFLLNKEFEIREKIKNRVKRGKVYLSVTVRKGELEEKFNEIDPAAVQVAVNILKDIKKSAKITDKIKLSDILLFQNMLFKDDSAQASEEFDLVVNSSATGFPQKTGANWFQNGSLHRAFVLTTKHSRCKEQSDFVTRDFS